MDHIVEPSDGNVDRMFDFKIDFESEIDRGMARTVEPVDGFQAVLRYNGHNEIFVSHTLKPNDITLHPVFLSVSRYL